MSELTRILLVEDNPGDARLVEENLREVWERFEMIVAGTLSQASERVKKGGIDVVLLDLRLPDGEGVDLVSRLAPHAEDVPIIVLTGTYQDQLLAQESLKIGAQDYLYKDQITGEILARSIRYGIERKKTQRRLQAEIIQLARAQTARVQAEREKEQMAQLAAQLAEARDAALELSKAKSEFLAMMSHEFRTPLNSVIGMSDLLLETKLTPQQRKFVQTISRSGGNLLALISDVLDFSTIESGRMTIRIKKFDFHALIRDLAKGMAISARAKKLTLKTQLDPDVPKFINGDVARLGQVLNNLLNNAIKFTEEGGVVLRVRREPDLSRRTTIYVEISDTGIGIAQEDQERLFQAFTPIDASVRRKFGGAGLGLALSRKLIELMGGEIGAQSVKGQGSTFWVRF